MSSFTVAVRLAIAVLLGAAITGCASTQQPRDPRDPFEGFNRAVYRFNDTFDKAILKPVAQGYDAVVPRPVSRRVTSFFGNLDDVVVLANDVLQWKLERAANDTARISLNSTFGLLGLFDVATPMGHPKNNEDFGQTLGHWGAGGGPYLVLPFLGPSTVRDGIGRLADGQLFDPKYWLIEDVPTRNGMIALEAIDTRADLLRASRILEQAALDPYNFTRDAYLQRREFLIYDGNPPREEFDDFEDDFPGDAPAP